MKWTGQHIYDLVSRFRDEVYLEDLTTTTETNVLVVDSDGKVSKTTSIIGDITNVIAGTGLSGGGTSGNVTLTVDFSEFSAVTPAAGDSLATLDSDGANEQRTTVDALALLFAGQGLTAESGVITVDASQTQITGIGTITTGVWNGDPIATAYIADDAVTEDKLANTLLAEIDANTAKATNVATNLSQTTGTDSLRIESSDGTNVIVAEASGSIAGMMTVAHHDKLDGIETSATADQSKSDIDGLAITTVGTLDTGNATAIVDAASLTAAGKVELATTIEADTGSDTDRAVTPAGLKSHVDGRYSYVYMTWSASGTSTMNGSDPEWVFPNTTKGIYEEDWNQDENITATSVATTTYTVSRHSAVNALVMPHTGICVGFHAHGRNNNSDVAFKAGLFFLEGSTTGTTNNGGIDYGHTANTHDAALRWIATANEAEASGGADGTASHSFKAPCKLVSNVTAIAVSAGDALLPAIMGPDASDEIFVTMTIILKIPLA